MKNSLLLAALCFALYGNTQLPFMDNDFGMSGLSVVSAPFAGYLKPRMIVQPDGRVLVKESRYQAGQSDQLEYWLHRFLSNGSLDSSFGQQGSIFLNPANTNSRFSYGDMFQLQPDGKILTGYRVVGTSNIQSVILRFTPEGTPDASFGNNGRRALVDIPPFPGQSQNIHDLVLRNDGKIVLVYFSDFVPQDYGFRLLDENGDLLPDYEAVKWHVTEVREFFRKAMPIQGNKIMLGGALGTTNATALADSMALYQFDENFDLDTTFGNNGIVSRSYVGQYEDLSDFMQTPDGRILACGIDYEPNQGLWIARFRGDGSDDLTFGNQGHVVYPEYLFPDDKSNQFIPNDFICLNVQPNGKILVGGMVLSSANTGELEIGFGRFLSDGQIDSSLSTAGWVYFARELFPDKKYMSAQDIVALDDNHVLTCGHFYEISQTAGMCLAAYEFSETSGLSSLNQKGTSVRLFPNPTQDYLQLDFEIAWQGQPAYLAIYDLLGQKIRDMEINAVEPMHRLALESLPAGTYLLHLHDAQQRSAILRFIKG